VSRIGLWSETPMNRLSRFKFCGENGIAVKMKRLLDSILGNRFSIYVTSLALLLAVLGSDRLRETAASYFERVSWQKIINPRLKSKDKYVLAKTKDTLVHSGFRNGNIKMVHGVGGTFDPISLGDSFTVEVIVKPRKEQISYSHIIGNHPGFNYFEGFALQQDGDTQNAYTFGYGNGKQWLPPVRFELAPEKWSYIVTAVEKGQMKVYRNGVLVAFGDADDSIKNSEMPLSVGNHNGKDRPFSGLIAEFRVSNRSLSNAEISQNWGHFQRSIGQKP